MSTTGLSAQVRTNDGWAVPHAVLTVIDLTGTQIGRVSAAEDGSVVAAGVPAGTYTAIVTAVGYTPAARTAIVPASGVATLGVVQLTRVGGLELPPPGPWTIDPQHSVIGFTVRHLGMANIRGRFTEVNGRIEVTEPIERSSVHASISVASLDTSVRMRDAHLLSSDFLEVERYPTIDFYGTGVTPAGDDKWTMNGELTLHGEARPVQLALAYHGAGPDAFGGTRAAFKATAQLNRDDFGISYNQIIRAGTVLIGTTVQVELDIEVVQGTSIPGLEPSGDEANGEQPLAAGGDGRFPA
jgi:polyisoprenoid-binding protein YceI